MYHGDELAAVFPLESGPTYYGAAGQRVRELVNRPRTTFNPYYTTALYGGLITDDWLWLASSVASGLYGSAYRMEAAGLPPMGNEDDEEGVIY